MASNDMTVALSTLSLNTMVDSIIEEVSGCSTARSTPQKKGTPASANSGRLNVPKKAIKYTLPTCAYPTSPLYNSFSPMSVNINIDRALNSRFQFPGVQSPPGTTPASPPMALDIPLTNMSPGK